MWLRLWMTSLLLFSSCAIADKIFSNMIKEPQTQVRAVTVPVAVNDSQASNFHLLQAIKAVSYRMDLVSKDLEKAHRDINGVNDEMKNLMHAFMRYVKEQKRELAELVARVRRLEDKLKAKVKKRGNKK